MSVNPYESPQVAKWVGKGLVGKVFFVLAAYVAPAGVLLLALLAYYLPVLQRASPKANRTRACYVNMRTISFALSNYHEEFGEFPPACTTDAEGNPLHSWRTLILPYIGQEELYKKIDLSKPWDGPVNREACTTTVTEYRCPAATKNGDKQYLTPYLACVGNDFALHPTRGRKLSEITDGVSTTLLLVEVPIADAVPWGSPQDASEAQVLALASSTKVDRSHYGGRQLVFCDGHISGFDAEVTEAQIRSLLTIDAGDNEELSPVK